MEKYSFSFIFAITSVVFCIIFYLLLVVLVALMHPGLVFGFIAYIGFIAAGIWFIEWLSEKKVK